MTQNSPAELKPSATPRQAAKTLATSANVRPEPVPPQTPVPPRSSAPAVKGPTADEIAAARDEPFIRKALDLFDGRLVNVERVDSPQPTGTAEDTDTDDES